NILIAESVAILKIGMSKFDAAYWIVVIDLRIVPLATTIDGIEIETLAPCQVVHRIEAMPAMLIVRHLQAVILGSASIGHGNEMPYERLAGYGISKCAGERPFGIAFLRRGADPVFA